MMAEGRLVVSVWMTSERE
ncbi:hypothetical protein EYF80_024912 [Liparis tanakae]|uniref:Uncharacterized protein n=1 Tax=Liparis tanakae TaxID=230148 RepID=A0A4Z2HGU1_9TELE|nr:hypothetical protein EYF80_024912 [Liparis tanakae]